MSSLLHCAIQYFSLEIFFLAVIMQLYRGVAHPGVGIIMFVVIYIWLKYEQIWGSLYKKSEGIADKRWSPFWDIGIVAQAIYIIYFIASLLFRFNPISVYMYVLASLACHIAVLNVYKNGVRQYCLKAIYLNGRVESALHGLLCAAVLLIVAMVIGYIVIHFDYCFSLENTIKREQSVILCLMAAWLVPVLCVMMYYSTIKAIGRC